MDKKHEYSLTIKWTGNKGKGTEDYRSYERSHSIIMENKPDILCSSEHVFRGDRYKYNPEELFVASISACHMLWYLHLCADAGIIVLDYVDNATATLLEASDGSGRFADVTLHPAVTIKDESAADKAQELHKRANELCFIANSCNFKISHEPVCVVKKD